MTAVGQPVPAVLGVRPVSRLPDFWTGEEYDLTALSGAPGGTPCTFARASTASVLDSLGVSRTVNHSQPAWEQVDWDADAIRETPSLLLGANDLAFWAHDFTPQAMTLYLEFVENGAKAIASAGLYYLGIPGNSGARFWVSATGTVYQLNYHNGTTLVTSTLGAGPATGDRVAIRGVLDVATKIQIFQSINGAAETSGALSAANALPANWGTVGAGSAIYMGSTGSTNKGNTKFVRRRLAWGVKTAAQMQALR